MKMKVIAIINNKGGVGKSASAVTIAHMAAAKFNKKVLLIDVDPQGNSSSLYDDTDIMDILANMLRGIQNPNETKSVEDLFLDSEIDIHTTIKHTAYDNLDIIPALLTLSVTENKLKGDIMSPQQFRLAQHLKKVEEEYDYCIIDCSPSISILNINALTAADEVYIPIKCDAWSAIGMCIAKDLISTVQSYNSKLKISGIFFTQFEALKNISKNVYALLQSFVAKDLLPFTISKNKLIEEMTFEQVPLLIYDKNQKSKVTKDYLILTEYMIASDADKKILRNNYQTINNK